LVIEIDGDTHDNERDLARDRHLASRGYTTVRFTNAEVRANLDGVLTAIVESLRKLPDRWPGLPHPNPSPEGEGL